MSFMEIQYEIKLIISIDIIGIINSIIEIFSPENRRITRVIGDILAATDLLDIYASAGITRKPTTTIYIKLNPIPASL